MSEQGIESGLNVVRLAIEGAPEVAPAPAQTPGGAKPDASKGAPAKGGPSGEVKLPADCPVVPLGRDQGTYFYLDAAGQLRALAAEKHNRLNIMALFGRRSEYLYETWPRWTCTDRTTGSWAITGWKPELAAEALMVAAAERPIWNPLDKVCGPGAWTDADGNLVLHCGDAVWLRGEWRRPGVHSGKVYPAGEALPRPYDIDPHRGDAEAEQDRKDAEMLLATLSSWNWKRPDVDALLLLGWIASALLGGALRWRPLAFVTGGSGTGKSTLHELLRHLFGPGALLSLSDTTAAGVQQTVGHASLPVAVDELEAEEDNRKVDAVVKLARLAASGGEAARGGSDHQAHRFTQRNCFLFSAINIPPLLGQDRNRMAILELDELRNRAEPDLTPAVWLAVGRRLRRRLIQHWPRWRDTLAKYRMALLDEKHSKRVADVFGTILAAADLLLGDDVPGEDTVRGWAMKLSPERLGSAIQEERGEFRCLQHIVTSSVADGGRGNQETMVAELIRRAARPAEGEDGNAAGKELYKVGLRIEQLWKDRPGLADRTVPAGTYLAVANNHTGLVRLFRGTHWQARSGAGGGWSQDLRRLPGAEASAWTMHFGTAVRGTLIPINLVLDAPSDGATATAANATDEEPPVDDEVPF